MLLTRRNAHEAAFQEIGLFSTKRKWYSLFVDIDREKSCRMLGLRRKSPSTPFVRVPHPGCIMHRWLESDFDEWEKDYMARIIYMPLAFKPSTAERKRMRDRVIIVNTETKCDKHVRSSGLQKNNVIGAYCVKRTSNDCDNFSANRSSFVRSPRRRRPIFFVYRCQSSSTLREMKHQLCAYLLFTRNTFKWWNPFFCSAVCCHSLSVSG